MNKRYFKEKGITLIALVITIIVLIILAGVSINLVLGEKGIVEKAKEAEEKYENEQEKEKEVINKIHSDIQQNTGLHIIFGPTVGGTYDDPYIPAEFMHIDGDGNWDTGFVIKEVATANEFVWVPCTTDRAKVKPGDNVVDFKKTTTGAYNTPVPALGLLPSDTTVSAEDLSAEELRQSVENYGGFYIARYEAGIEGTIDNYNLTEKKPTDGTVKAKSIKGKSVWNYVSRIEAITLSKAMIDSEKTGVKSTLISGTAWDTTLRWIISTPNNTGFDINSTSKGWFSDVSDLKIHTTGYYEINHVFDIAGNVWEWTTENAKYYDNTYAVSRGGTFVALGKDYPAASRGDFGNATNKFNDIGFRPVIYKIKVQ